MTWRRPGQSKETLRPAESSLECLDRREKKEAMNSGHSQSREEGVKMDSSTHVNRRRPTLKHTPGMSTSPQTRSPSWKVMRRTPSPPLSGTTTMGDSYLHYTPFSTVLGLLGTIADKWIIGNTHVHVTILLLLMVGCVRPSKINARILSQCNKCQESKLSLQCQHNSQLRKKRFQTWMIEIDLTQAK